MSFLVEVQTEEGGKFYTNAIRLGSREEANVYGKDLFSRWMSVRDWRVAESEDQVNYQMLKKSDGLYVLTEIK